MTGGGADDLDRLLQQEIDLYAGKLKTRPMHVGMQTDDGLSIFVAGDATYHFSFYERGKLVFDRAGTQDDLLYWYCEHIVTNKASYLSDRKARFRCEYDILNRLNPEWAKRRVRELAVRFREYRPADPHPEDLELLPEIDEIL